MQANIAAVRKSLLRALQSKHDSEECGAAILEALTLLEELEASENAKAAAAAAPRRVGVSEYSIQPVQGQPMLVESRPNQSHPFRVRASVYMALAKVFQDHPNNLDFNAIRLKFMKEARSAEYEIRVILRFWIRNNLVERVRGNYRAVSEKTILRDARRVWERLLADSKASSTP